MNIEYSVTERIVRLEGRIDEIEYEFEELTIEHLSTETTNRRERRTLTYQSKVNRQIYNNLQRQGQTKSFLTFDHFILIFRPFLFGFYEENQLEEAFDLLVRRSRGHEQIDLDQFEHFLLFFDPTFTLDRLKIYLNNIQIQFDNDQLNYQQFRTIILKGIGRQIICQHI